MQEQFVYSQKNNFSGGELTPTIEGRTELALYQNGVKKLINFMLLPSGGIMRRHGTQFVYLFSDNVPRKMAAVMFSRKLSYLLVFESHKLHTNCLFFVGGELFLTSKIIKDDGQDFHFRPKDFSYVVFQGIAYISFGTKRPIFKFSVDLEIVEQFYNHIDNQAKQRQEQYGERAEIASSSSMEKAGNFPDKNKMFIIEPLKCQVNYFTAGQSSDTSVSASGGNINKKQMPFNEVIYGAEVDKINDELKAIHQRAVAQKPAGQAGNSSSSGSVYEARSQKIYCSSVIAFENRLWCFGVNDNIHSIWASYKGDFADFRMAYKTLLEARNPLTAFSATFSSATFDNVLWSIPFASELLLGTSDGIYLVKEGDRGKGEFIKIHKEIDLPVAPLKPVILGKTIFFVEGNGCKINSLYYSQEKGGFQISDITAYAEHIFVGGIRQIIGSNSPFSMIFAVLKNGSFATFSYSHDLKIMGWSQHWLGGNGEVLNITPIYADNEDRLYFHVRRNDDTGISAKEYLEVLQTRYFSAKNFDRHKVVYADCHVNIQQPSENATDHSIMQVIKDDTAYEFRGGITKLEHIVQAQAETILRLRLGNDNLGSKDNSNNNNSAFVNSFRYKNKTIADYGEYHEAIESFLKNYYRHYQPKIMEILGISFAYYRIFSYIYAEFENLFCGAQEGLAKIEQLFYDGERLGGDLIKAISGEELNQTNKQNMVGGGSPGVQNWEIPIILRDGGLMEYIPNGAFSFHPTICSKIKNLNLDLIRITAGIVKEIIASTKKTVNQQFEISKELQELRLAASYINKRMLLYYTNQDNNNCQELLVNIKMFFEKKSIDFYTELLNIAHPTLTKYLFSEQVSTLINRQIADFNQTTGKEQIAAKLPDITKQLMEKLRQIDNSNRIDQLVSFKRRDEIVEVIREIMLDKFSAEESREYILSSAFKKVIENVIDEVVDKMINETSKEVKAEIEGQKAKEPEEDKDDKREERAEESVALIVARQMQELRESLANFHRNLIEYCQLIMPHSHPSLLKSILEDEKSIKLEKYLLLSKKYFPVFKKLFPDIGAYELNVIARNCLPSFQQLTVTGILPIFQKIIVAIIGDEELHDLRIIDNERIKLKHPVRYLSIGFPYSSVLQTFPLIFPDEVEHAPKKDAELGLKLFDSKGGYIEEELDNGAIERQHINSKYLDSDALVRFVNDKKYLTTARGAMTQGNRSNTATAVGTSTVITKGVCDLLATPYQSGWVNFIMQGQIKTDIDITFKVDKPYPVSILKIFAKAKILPNYKG
jgi:hypothetical protein